jgi:phage regulator Rha-like protein
MQELVEREIIESKIYFLRGRKVMLDADLAILDKVPTKSLNLAVKRNLSRFPEDFMFQLTISEVRRLRFQAETSKAGRGGRRYQPYVFTEQGVAMLSSVLRSERAVQVNIQIMRTFARLSRMLQSHSALRRKIEEMGKKYDQQFQVVFDAIKRLLQSPPKEEPPKRRIGFHRYEQTGGS